MWRANALVVLHDLKTAETLSASLKKSQKLEGGPHSGVARRGGSRPRHRGGVAPKSGFGLVK